MDNMSVGVMEIGSDSICFKSSENPTISFSVSACDIIDVSFESFESYNKSPLKGAIKAHLKSSWALGSYCLGIIYMNQGIKSKLVFEVSSTYYRVRHLKNLISKIRNR